MGSLARKRILIDASPITNRVDGLSVYIVNLIKHLPESSFERFHYSILVHPDLEWPDLASAMRDRPFRVIRERIATIGPKRDWDLWRFFRSYKGEFDLVHITSNNYPSGLKGGIGTIHDVTFKSWFEGRRGIPGYAALARLYMSAMIRNCLRNADAIIAVSHSTQNEVERWFRISEAERRKFKIIHEGWEHLVDYEQGTCEGFGQGEGGYLLFLGSHRPHKNLVNCLEGFRQALGRIPPDRKLVIGGSSSRLSRESRRIVESLNADRQRVVFTGYLSNACVREHYRHADAFVFPSLSEGFGIPVLEAFYFGTPLLSSKSTALSEVAGDAALYFDPRSPEEIADAIVSFYADPSLRIRLSEKGLQRLRRFSWAKMAQETVELYEAQTGDRPPDG